MDIASLAGALAGAVESKAGAFATGFGGVAGGGMDLANAFTAEGAGSIAQRPGTAVGGTTSLGVAGMEGIDAYSGNYFSQGISTLTDSAGRVSANLDAARQVSDSALTAVGDAQMGVDGAQEAVDTADSALNAALSGTDEEIAQAQEALDQAQSNLTEAQSRLADANSEMNSAAQAEQRADANQAKEDKDAKWDCPILKAAAVTHTLLSLANGFNSPNRGDDLVLAASHLNTALRDRVSASDTRGWVGDGRNAYATANERHRLDVDEVRKIDLLFKDQLIVQADQVLDLRQVFGYVRTTIMLAQPVASAMNAAGLFDASIYFQTTVATTCLSTDTSHQGIQHDKAVENAKEFTKLQNAYDALPTTREPAPTGEPETRTDRRDIERLRDFHAAALGSLSESAKAVKESLSRNVGNTHGAVCMASRDAVKEVQASRELLLSRDEFSGKLQINSQEFVDDLNKTLKVYEEADRNTAATLNNQISSA